MVLGLVDNIVNMVIALIQNMLGTSSSTKALMHSQLHLLKDTLQMIRT